MIDHVDQLSEYQIVLLLYATGASGEFVATALTNSIESFAKSPNQWIKENRKNFDDALRKTLNGGWNVIDNNDVVQRFNWHLENNAADKNSLHLALAHPDPASIQFIQDHLSHAQVIEITTNLPVSLRFKTLSQHKVSYEDYINGGDNKVNGMTQAQYEKFQKSLHHYGKNKLSAQKHLKVEWQHLLLTNTLETFEKICNFLQCSGRSDIFVDQVREYLDRNQGILKQIQV